MNVVLFFKVAFFWLIKQKVYVMLAGEPYIDHQVNVTGFDDVKIFC